MFEGAIVALVTPFKNGKIDKEALKRLIDFQIDNGTDAIVPCGTTGESATLSLEEHQEVVELTLEFVGGRVPVIAGAGSNNTEEAINLTRHAKQVGAQGALLITPYYNRPTQEGLYQHYKKIAEEVDIPIILYNVPARTGVNLLPETVKRLNQIPNIVGIKEASGSIKQVCDLITLCDDNLLVLSGEDYMTFPILALGGRGVISVVSNVAPKDMAELWDSFREGDISVSRRIHYKILPLADALFLETNPIPVKTALHMMGMIEEELRLPLTPMSEGNRAKLKRVMEEFGLS